MLEDRRAAECDVADDTWFLRAYCFEDQSESRVPYENPDPSGCSMSAMLCFGPVHRGQVSGSTL